MKLKSTYIFIISLLLISILSYVKLFEAIDFKVLDNYITFDKKKTTSKDIVIVEIDNSSVSKLGQWPWKRSYIAEALNIIRVTEPAVIGLEVSYTENTSPEQDSKLFDSLKSIENIVIVRKYKQKFLGNKTIQLPVSTVFKGITEGHLLLKLSRDGAIRHTTVFPEIDGSHDSSTILAFSLEILKMYLNSSSTITDKQIHNLKKLFKLVNSYNKNTRSMIFIDYKRSLEQFNKISFIDVLGNNFSEDFFKNKIVLIGVTNRSNAKLYTTPFTGVISNSSSSVELQAQIIDSFLSFRNILQTPEWLVVILSIILAISFMLVINRKKIVVQGLIFVSLILSLAMIDYILYHHFGIWFPPALTLILFTTTFALSVFFTSSNIDSQISKTISKYQDDKNVPLLEIPDELDGKVNTFANLMDIINTDRQTIKAIINGVNNGVLVFDASGKILWANDRILHIYNNHLLLDENICNIIPEFNISNIIEEIRLNNVCKIDIREQQHDYLCIINPITENANQDIVIFNEVTELKELDRLKTNMVRMVSHELKSPLMVIQLCSENIEFLEDKTKINQQNEKIFNASNLMLDTITNFLSLNKLESGLMETDFQSTPVSDLINMSLSLQTTIAEDKGLSIEFVIDTVENVIADKNQVNIVLNNLISNAIKYSKKGDKITVKVEQDEEFVYTSVRDYGIGMSEEDTKKVFDKFFRSKENKKYKIKGTGLGLSIVQKIIETHKGSITVTSKLNEGTCFRFSLPIAKSE